MRQQKGTCEDVDGATGLEIQRPAAGSACTRAPLALFAQFSNWIDYCYRYLARE